MSTCTILHVEDEMLIRFMLADQLKSRGFEIIDAVDANEALSLLNADLSFDLLLTDVKMPGPLDGYELARLVREKLPEVKVIICSAHIPMPEWDEVADAILSKPYDWPELVRVIVRLLA